MTVTAVVGVAGSGKTHRLVNLLVVRLAMSPLKPGQRVLALTFMHGSRRKLEHRLRSVPGISGQFECITVDSFAWHLLHRWRSLAVHRQLPWTNGNQFDLCCDSAGALLEETEPRKWIARGFPIVVVDEAQDLKAERLRIIRAVSADVALYVAADEFQCLDSSLRPNPLIEWLPTVCTPEELNKVRRTSVPALLNAAIAIRAGMAPVAGSRLRILPAIGLFPAAAQLASAIRYGGGGTIAVIAPSLQGGFARSVVNRVSTQPCGQQGHGPYAIHWERSEQEEAIELLSNLNIGSQCSWVQAALALAEIPKCGPVQRSQKWLYHQHHALGRNEFTRVEIEQNLRRQLSLRRQRFSTDSHRLLALTVHQAKNREFDGVVVIWPYQVGGSDEDKRRLLYNAITRARQWCTVIVQGQSLRYYGANATRNEPPRRLNLAA